MRDTEQAIANLVAKVEQLEKRQNQLKNYVLRLKTQFTHFQGQFQQRPELETLHTLQEQYQQLAQIFAEPGDLSLSETETASSSPFPLFNLDGTETPLNPAETEGDGEELDNLDHLENLDAFTNFEDLEAAYDLEAGLSLEELKILGLEADGDYGDGQETSDEDFDGDPGALDPDLGLEPLDLDSDRLDGLGALDDDDPLESLALDSGEAELMDFAMAGDLESDADPSFDGTPSEDLHTMDLDGEDLVAEDLDEDLDLDLEPAIGELSPETLAILAEDTPVGDRPAIQRENPIEGEMANGDSPKTLPETEALPGREMSLDLELSEADPRETLAMAAPESSVFTPELPEAPELLEPLNHLDSRDYLEVEPDVEPMDFTDEELPPPPEDFSLSSELDLSAIAPDVLELTAPPLALDDDGQVAESFQEVAPSEFTFVREPQTPENSPETPKAEFLEGDRPELPRGEREMVVPVTESPEAPQDPADREGEGNGTTAELSPPDLSVDVLETKIKERELRFVGLRLQGLDLQKSDLSYCYFDDSDLSHGNLEKTTLRETTFKGSRLAHSNFRRAHFYRTQFLGAHLVGANFSHSILEQVNFSQAHCPGADFSEADLSFRVRWDGGDFTAANFFRANLRRVKFPAISFRGANLRQANLMGADLSAVDLTDATLEDAIYSDRTVFPPDFQPVGAHLIQPQANLAGANLSGINLKGVNLIGANLAGANLSHSNLNRSDLSEANLRGALLHHAFLEAQFLEACLENADLHQANLQNANLTGANLQGANLQNANLKYSNFTTADLRGANFQNTDSYRANFNGANLEGIDLEGVDFEGDLSGANLQNANLKGVNLSYLDLSWANFSGADLTGVNFRKANVDNANFQGAIGRDLPQEDNPLGKS